VLVVRADEDGLRRYCHIGTGNYNSRTARLYEDVGVLTCNPPVGDDVAQLFNHLTGYSRAHDYYSLLVAPRDMRNQLIDLIEHEARFGSEGRIIAKLNSLGDPELVEALYEASNAGVHIDLVIRGICCLRPGVPGMSENIRVRSILGRYLEHSRIIRFAHGEEGGPMYMIGSADWMPRNLDRRIEVLVPVSHPKHQAWLDQVFAFQLADDIVRWELGGEGSWQRRGPEMFTHGDSQERFYHWVAARQKR
jgi:polyphosphate kinase